MEKPTFEEIRQIVRAFTSVIPYMTDIGLDEVGLAIGKEKHRRSVKRERFGGRSSYPLVHTD